MKKVAVLVACVLGLMLPAASADAALINLVIGDSYYVGSINDGIPSSPADEVAYINYLITLAPETGDMLHDGETYNREGGIAGPFPLAFTAGSYKDELGPAFTVPNGYAYVLGKYDASHAGTLVWFVNGAVDTFNLPETYNGRGLSHVSAYNPVPDGGATLILLGAGLVGLGAFRRRK